MESKPSPSNNSAARIMASTFGCISGLGGITHGVGEMLQGNVPTGGVVVNSWTEGPIATYIGGEPAMPLLPTLLTTGLTTILFSLATIIWAVFFVQRQFGGLVLILLSIAMLLVGAGFASPHHGHPDGGGGAGDSCPLLVGHTPSGEPPKLSRHNLDLGVWYLPAQRRIFGGWLDHPGGCLRAEQSQFVCPQLPIGNFIAAFRHFHWDSV
jgi:hypothetical protein